MKNKRTPEIRFLEFNANWEERMLDDLLLDVSRPLKMVDDETYQLVTVKRRNGGIVPRGFFKGSEVLVKSQFIIKSGDYLISKRQVVHGANGIVPDYLDGSIVSNEYLVLHGTKDLSIGFFSLISGLPSMYKNFFLSSYGIDIEKLVFNVSDWKKRKIFIPSISEQQKITSFFEIINNAITLHQQELTTLKQTKQGFLQKMFPREKESIPEVRFTRFTGNWEQHKLCDVADMFDNLRIPVTASERIKGATPYYGANGVQDYVEGFTHDGEFVLVAEDGANDLINYPVNYVNGKVWINNHAHVISGQKEILDNLFLVTRIRSMNISTYLVGGGRAKLNGETLKKIPITIPSFEEQVEIGKFFKKIDDVIALHQRELDALKETKKAFLQKMFV
ncbi:restriction endonuclease subunit S [Priestia megaterium]|uniref:restriction endonuclease subunit S n=1 Tax=Priestia megaterium TaxID=1404 RepID=UPI003D087F9D